MTKKMSTGEGFAFFCWAQLYGKLPFCFVCNGPLCQACEYNWRQLQALAT
jgi:hypothetical protein